MTIDLVDDEVVDEDWYARDLTGARFVRVRFLETDLTEAVVAGATFEECVLRGVSLNAATVTDTAFTSCAMLSASSWLFCRSSWLPPDPASVRKERNLVMQDSTGRNVGWGLRCGRMVAARRTFRCARQQSRRPA